MHLRVCVCVWVCTLRSCFVFQKKSLSPYVELKRETGPVLVQETFTRITRLHLSGGQLFLSRGISGFCRPLKPFFQGRRGNWDSFWLGQRLFVPQLDQFTQIIWLYKMKVQICQVIKAKKKPPF